MKKNSNFELLLTSIIVGTIFSFPIVGFIDGFKNCYECDGIFVLFEKSMRGFVGALTSTITFGKPFYNEGGVGGNNIRANVFISAIILSVLIFAISKRQKNKLENK